MAAPYALSSDLVSAWPAKSLEVAQYIDGQVPLLAMTQNAQTGTTYTFVATDFTKLVTLSNASAVAVTLPLESSVAWPTGTQLRLLNQGAGTVTVAGAVGVTINGTPLTLTQYKGANLIKTGTNTWTFVPFASGIGAAVYSDANTGTYTGYAYKTFTDSGTLNVTTAGFADLIVVGGGGGGGWGTANRGGGGGGAGGCFVKTSVYLPVGTHTITVGAGGTAGSSTAIVANGTASSVADLYFGVGGGFGGQTGTGPGAKFVGGTGGSGGGSADNTLTSASGISTQGFAGGTCPNNGPAGGGGGASAVGANTTSLAGGAGGAGTTTTIAGTTPSAAYVAGSYAFGGGGGGGNYSATAGAGGSGGGGAGSGNATAATAGTINTGGGGGGGGYAGSGTNSGGQGGKGIVIVRVAV
jgi:hypothetical protein